MSAAAAPGERRRWRERLKAWRAHKLKGRWLLWSLLLALVASLLVLLIWLAGRYESSAAQNRLEADVADLAGHVRNGLARNQRSLQALQPERVAQGRAQANELMMQRRELVRIEWRDADMLPRWSLDTPLGLAAPLTPDPRPGEADAGLACGTAVRFNSPAYSGSYFVPRSDGLGQEIMDICLPLASQGQLTGFVVASYSLGDVLAEHAGAHLGRGQVLAFTEADGTRLALLGSHGRGDQLFTAQHLLDLPGTTLVLRLESRQGTAGLFPNLLTALVTALALALCVVVVLLLRDMRRRLKVEADLAEALAFRKAMEDSLSTGLRARDLEGRITYVNPAFCKMVGVDASELLNGQAMPAPYWPPELAGVYQDRQAWRLAHQALPRGGHESVFMRSDGTRFPVLIIEAPLINAQGRHTGWMSAVLDLSEQKRAEELSRASQDRLQATARLAMVGEMASLLSHELNQPLAAISSYANGSNNLLEEARREGSLDTAEQRRLAEDLEVALRRIAEQASRAGKVIKSVHDFVRRRDQRREAVRPLHLLDAIMPLVSLQARKLAVRVMIAVEPDCPDVLCDRTMVEQVLLNLARNGMQSMQSPAGADSERVLHLRVREANGQQPGARPGRWVEFSVADMGEGIPPEVAERLFTPFFTTKEEGMGLGLSLCRTVAEQHGGALWFEAQRPRGTIFLFTLPAAPATPAPAPALANP